MTNKFTLSFFSFCFFLMGFAQEVHFKASIKNPNTNSIFIRSGRSFNHEIKGDEKGNFESTFKAEANIYQFYDGVEYTTLFLKPGTDLSLEMDATEFDESIVYTGVGAKENNYLAQKALSNENEELFGMMDLEKEAFYKTFEVLKEKRLAALEAEDLDLDFKSKYKRMLLQEFLRIQQYYAQAQKTKKLNGIEAPNFTYENIAGEKVSLIDFKGKYVYIDVWATWCAPCRAEIPHLKEVEKAFHDKDIVFISLSVDALKDKEKWTKMVKEKELGGVQIFADNSWSSDFVKAFEINSIPRFLLIDPDGIVLDADAARPSDKKLTKQLNELMP